MPPLAANSIVLYVVYDHPRDYPEHFVVRQWEMDQPTDRYTLHDSLAAARASIPFGLACLHRDEEDEPQILETWL